MSPENPTTPETHSEQPLLDGAQKTLETVTKLEQDENTALRALTAVSDYLDDVLDRAANGEITRTDEQALAYSRSELIDQFEALVKELNEKGEMASLKLIPRAGGLRRGLTVLLTHEATGQVTMDALQAKVDEYRAKEREALRSEEELDEIGNEALDAAGVKDPMEEAVRIGADMAVKNPEPEKLTRVEYLDTITSGLSSTDKDTLKDYAVAIAAQDRARQNGEFDNVASWKKDADASFSKLSGTAQSIASRFAAAFNHYE